jgi:tetratricopeptide (TPR) repeat protein
MKRSFVLVSSIISLLSSLSSASAVDEYEVSLKNKAMQQFRQGLAAEQAGDLQQAIEWYRKSVSTYPKFKEVHYKLGLDSAKVGNNDEAMMEFRQALNLDNNYVQARNDYALFLKYNKNDEKGAMAAWKQCTQIDPRYPFPYYFMGQVYHEKGDLENAINNFETVCRLKPDLSDAHKELGMCIFERAQGDDIMTAAKALETSARLAPNNPMVHYYLGTIYATKGDLDAAEAEWRTSLSEKCDRRLAAAHWELGKLRYYRGDMDRCMSEMSEALKVNPTYTTEKKYPVIKVPSIKALNAQCLEYKGKLGDAIEAYLDLARVRGSDALYAQHIEDLKKKIKLIEKERKKKPLTYDPEEVDALVSKGQEQYEDGDLDGAKASFERALELNPMSVEALMNLSATQEAQGDLNAAVASNQKAIAACPQFDGAYYNLGYLLEKMNLPTDAGMMYSKFHQVAGKYPYDPQHVIKLQQDLIRQQKIEENRKNRGY